MKKSHKLLKKGTKWWQKVKKKARDKKWQTSETNAQAIEKKLQTSKKKVEKPVTKDAK